MAKALLTKGVRLERLGREEEAFRAHEGVVSRFGNATEAGIRQQVAHALLGKGNALRQLGRREEAIRAHE